MSPIGIYHTDASGKALYLSSCWCEIAGMSRVEALGEGWIKALHPDDKDHVTDEWSKCIKQQCQFRAEYRFLRPDGIIVWLSGQAEPKINSEGDSEGFLGTITDITATKGSDNQLTTWAQIFDCVDLGIAIGALSEDKYESVNPAMARMHGYEVEELKGKSIKDLYAPADAQLLQEALRIAEDKGSYIFEARRKRKDGSIFPARTHATVIKDRNGDMHYRAAIVQDITAQQKAEAEIRASEHKFKLLFEKSPIANFASNKDGILIDANRKAGQLLAATPDELIGSAVLSLYADTEDGVVKAKKLLEHWKKGGEIQDEELVMKRFDGQHIWISLTVTPILNEQNEVIATQASVIDITVRKEAENERAKLIEKLQTKNAEMERFTYTVSHDLKSPLITIKGFLGILEQDLQGNNSDKITENINFIKSAADNMYLLLHQLLDLSEAVNKATQYRSVPLEALIHSALDKVKGQIDESDAVIKVHPNLPEIYCDEDRMREVFQNLIDNAIKFRRDRSTPHIEISAEDKGSHVLCRVKDDGIGIDKNYQSKIFDLFERLDQSVSGTGIGLALVKGIIDKHGGEIAAKSDGKDKGTAFYLNIPVATKRSE